MANIPLKSINFPGLDDTYTVPVVDDTLSVSGAAADAKKTGDEITDLKDDLNEIVERIDDAGIDSSEWRDICAIIPSGGTYTTNVAIGSTVDATIRSSTSFGCQLVAVQKGDLYKVHGTGGNNALLWAFTDSAYTLISKAIASIDPQTVELTAPEDGYLFVNAKTTGGASYSLEKYIVEYTVKELSASVDDLESRLYRKIDVDISDKIAQYVTYSTNIEVGNTVDMTPVQSTQYCSVVDECNKGQQYKITGLGGARPRLWCFINSDNIVASVSGNYEDVTDLVVTAPVDGKLIYQFSTSKPFAILKLNVTDFYTAQIFDSIDKMLYPYTGFDMFRTIAGLGDSYTEGDLVTSSNEWVTVSGINYLSSIAKRNGIQANNYGSGGARTDTYLDRPAFARCLSELPSDLYLVCFGINDASNGMTVGTVDDIKEDYTQNPDTFCGNYGKILDQLMAHAPAAKIILIMPWPTDADYSAYNSAVREIAQHYEIPCINPSDDIYFTSSFWKMYKSGGHPTAMLYAGMGRAIERLFNICVQNNPRYFRFALIG